LGGENSRDVEIYTDKVSPTVINFGSIADPFDDEKLARLRERNQHMRIERTVEATLGRF
jgi:hypothetical protein